MPRPTAPSLGLVVMTSGLASLGAEIAAARLLAPAFGSSTVIWANTIAIVLVALAIGAWFGGRLADAGPRPARMHQLLLGGAGLLALTPIIAVPLLGVGVRALDDISAPGFFGSLIAVLLLVAAPLALLGAVTPYAVRLALGAVEASGDDAIARAGSVAGRLSALATGGSLVGTFVASLALIPLVGTRRTFLVFALLLAVVAVWGLASARLGDGARPPGAPSADADGDDEDLGGGVVAGAFTRRAVALASLVPIAILALIIAPPPTVKGAVGDQTLLEERETSEQYARVLQSPDGTRTMELGEGHAVHSLVRPGTLLTQNYWDELLVLPQLAGHSPKRVLILGNAGGTTATAMRAIEPQVQVDAVDYDGQLTELGRRWFGLGGKRLRLLTGDARVELRRSSGGYDTIIVDAYRQPYIPFHLSTKEFFTLVRERLAPGGVVIVNVGHPERDEELEKVLGATMRAAGFGFVARDPAQVVNTQLVGRTTAFDDGALPRYADALGRTQGVGEIARDRRSLAQTARATAARLVPALRGGPVYTDDKAPVELLIDGSIAKFATGG
jgi:precorrin-6B methylase 2